MATLDDLIAQVASNTSVEQSALTLIQGLANQLQAALAANDSTQLESLRSQLAASASALAAAVTANTPAATVSPPITATATTPAGTATTTSASPAAAA